MGEGCSPALPPFSKWHVLPSLKWRFSSQSPQAQQDWVGREAGSPQARRGTPFWVECLWVSWSQGANTAAAPIGPVSWGSDPAHTLCSAAPREMGTSLCLPHTSREAWASWPWGSPCSAGPTSPWSELAPWPHGSRKQPARVRPLFPHLSQLNEVVPQTTSATVEKADAQPHRDCSCCPTWGAAMLSNSRRQRHSSSAMATGFPFPYELLPNDMHL